MPMSNMNKCFCVSKFVLDATHTKIKYIRMFIFVVTRENSTFSNIIFASQVLLKDKNLLLRDSGLITLKHGI